MRQQQTMRKTIGPILIFVALIGIAVNGFAEQLPHISNVVMKKIQEKGVKEGLALYYKLKAQNPRQYVFDQYQLNRVGYRLLREKKFEMAIKVFQENIKEYPGEANPADSLGEAYLQIYSDTLKEAFLEKAEGLFKRALKINSGFTTSKYQLNRVHIIRHYDKKEYMIPMRDGIKLFTQVYTPKDKSQTYPILFTRTPYNAAPKGEEKINYRNVLGPNMDFVKEKYIFVRQDVRGKFLSEGEFLQVRPILKEYRSKKDVDEATDTYDTIEWLIKNIANNNGRVGMFGCSYGGFYSVLGAVNAHPALKAISPHAPVADWFMGDDWHHNGALFLFQAVSWLRSNDNIRPKPIKNWPTRAFNFPYNNAYEFFLKLGPIANLNNIYFKDRLPFWNKMMNHPNYDQFWQERSTLPNLRNIKPVVLNVGGWFDAEDLYGTLATYQAIEKNNPSAQNTLIMGPWYHCNWYRIGRDVIENVRLNMGTASSFYNKEIILPFFNYHLKNRKPISIPEALMYNSGSLAWHKFDAWPPRDRRQTNYYLHSSGALSTAAPNVAEETHDEYVSDPAKPVPHTARISARWSYHFLHEDQRFVANRPDVLVYETPSLTDDVDVAGPITADLYVSTSATAADWVVKVIDVFPQNTPNPQPNPARINMGGYQMLVRGDVIRGRFRDSMEKPKPFEPGRVTRVKFILPDIFHTFKKGHKIMVQIQSSWFPLVDRNPQTYVNIYQAKREDFKKAMHRVYHSATYPSHIRLGVLKREK
jgi:putative CocE/NonD family hydrolase